MRSILLALTLTACGAAPSTGDGTSGGDMPGGGSSSGDPAAQGGGSSASSGGASGKAGSSASGGASSGGTSGGGSSGASGMSSSGSSGSGGPKHVGPASIYPDPALTPGAVFNVTASTICQSGYPASVRAVTNSEKAQVFARYGLVDTPAMYEVDHFVSLELGGSNDVTNLWPQKYNPAPGAHEKDGVEATLHAQLCNGKMTLAQVQQAIKTDWYAIYLNPPK